MLWWLPVLDVAVSADLTVGPAGDHDSVAAAAAAAATGDRLLLGPGLHDIIASIPITGALEIVGDPAGSTIVVQFLAVPSTQAFDVQGGALTVTDVDLQGGAPNTRGFTVIGGTLVLDAVSVFGFDLQSVDGGVISANNAAVSISDATFAAGSGLDGGHIHAKNGGSLEISASAFDLGVGANGGSVYASGVPTTIVGSTFTSNRALVGGALFVTGSDVVVEGSVFEGSSASWGGAIRAQGGSASIRSSTFIGNAADGDATVKIDNAPRVELTDNWFEANVVGGIGPAAYVTGSASVSVVGNVACANTGLQRVFKFTFSTTTFTNNVLHANSISSEGLSIYGGTADVHNNHFIANTGSQGVALATLDNAAVDARNNLFAFNTSTAGAAVHPYSGTIALGYNLFFANDAAHVTGTIPATNLVDVDPLITVDPTSCSLRDLVPPTGSPTLGAGDPALPDATGGPADIGAFGGATPNTLLDPVDVDGDGFEAGDDCNDQDPSIHPMAPEVACDGVDNDCDPTTEDAADADGDGVSACTDCDDEDPSVALEILTYLDADGDGFGHGPAIPECGSTESWVVADGDCDDARSDVFPGAPEQRDDGVDQDCDGVDLQTRLDGSTGCGCQGAPPLGGGAWVLMAAAFRRRATS